MVKSNHYYKEAGERDVDMTNGLIWAIIGLGVGWLVTKTIENKNNNSKFIYIILIVCAVALIIFLKTGNFGL